MSDPRRPGIPIQKARRIHADNQARGARARTQLERNRSRRRSVLAREARGGRRGQGGAEPTPARQRLTIAVAFVLSVGLGAAVGWPALDAVGELGGRSGARIERISVQGNYWLSSHDVAMATGVAPGQTGAEIEVDVVGERLRSHPWIRDAQVMRLPTGNLLISVDEREPVALLASASTTATDAPAAWRLVDDAGTPFAHATDPTAHPIGAKTAAGWPRLRGGDQLGDGAAHPELAAALVLSRHVEQARLAGLLGGDRPLELVLPRSGDPRGWVLDPGPGRPRVILGHDRLIERIDRLETLLRSELSELRGANEIDLRFADRAVLRSGPA